MFWALFSPEPSLHVSCYAPHQGWSSPPPHFKDGKTEAGEAKSFMQVEIALVSLGHGSTEAGWAAPA